MIKKFVETKRIKEIVVKSWLGKKIWILITFGVTCLFFVRLVFKRLLKFFGLQCITVCYDHPSIIHGISTKIVEPVRYPKGHWVTSQDSDTTPQAISSFAAKKHYDYIVSQIPNGKIFGQNTIATQDNTIIRHLTRRPHKGYAGNPWAYMFMPSNIVKITGTAIVLTGNDTFQNLNHRLTFGLAKYYLYEKAGIKADWYIVDNQKEFHREAREALGIPKDRMITPKTDTVYQFDTLIATNTTTIWGIVPPRMSQFIKGLFLPKVLAKPTRKLYLKRTGTRRILNEQEFDRYLQNHGFEIITTHFGKGESLDYELFAQAKCVLSPHGAGLTKIIFSQPKITVIEIFHPQTLFGHYYTMSKSLQLNYHCFVGKQDCSYSGLDMDAPIIIDMKQFDIFMSSINYGNNVL